MNIYFFENVEEGEVLILISKKKIYHTRIYLNENYNDEYHLYILDNVGYIGNFKINQSIQIRI